MQELASSLIFSPSDLNHFVECEHLTSLDVLAVAGQGIAKAQDPQAMLLRARGIEHEQAWLARLRDSGQSIITIAGEERVDWTRDAARTEQAMRDGADVIYQGVFVSEPWRGIADFLVRVATPSALWPWSYEAWDTKLWRHPKPYFILQLCWYSEQLARVQGTEPAWMHVVLGTNEVVPFALRDFAAYYRAVRNRFLRMVDEKRETYPYPVPHCRLCGYTDACDQRWRHDDHLSLVAGIRRDQVVRLNTAGVATMKELAAFDTTARVGIMPPTLERLARQADLQAAARTLGHRYELLQPERLRGFGLLPEPSAGDLFFDMEGYPYFESTRGLEYLFGVVFHDDGGWTFNAFECLDRAGEKRAFERFIDFVHERLLVDPGLHIHHYASYEPATLKRLMGQHVTREAEVDDLLRREVFVDLYQVVRQSMQISHESYSLKAVRQFFMEGAGQGAVTEGGESMREFHRFLETGDTSILAAIRAYNQEDCESTRQLRDWLLARKAEAETRFGMQIPWAKVQGRDPDKPLETDDENRELRERLLAISNDEPSSGRDRAACAGLLAHLVDYHRREARPEWWAFFDRLKQSLDDLLEDPQAVAYLEPAPGIAVVPEKRSFLHTMNFPRQEFKLRDEAQVCDPVGGGRVGTLVSIDSDGILVLKRGDILKDVALPRAIAAAGPPKDTAQREALVRVAKATLKGTADYRAGRDVLARRAPRILGVAGGAPFQTHVLEEQRSLVARLDDSYLFISRGADTAFEGL